MWKKGLLLAALVTASSMTQLLGSCGEGKWLALIGGIVVVGGIISLLANNTTTTT